MSRARPSTKPRQLLGLLMLFGLYAIAARADTGPALLLDAGQTTVPGLQLSAPLGFANAGHHITAIAFSLDLDGQALSFDSADSDGDGIPEGVALVGEPPEWVLVTFDAQDPAGELDVLLANPSGMPLAEGVILELRVTPIGQGALAAWIRFAEEPPPSFGDHLGQDVPGTAEVVDGSALFADGFECGAASAWSGVSP